MTYSIRCAHISIGVVFQTSLASSINTHTPGDITVLIADALHKAEYYAALRRLPLPRPASWLEGGRDNNTVLIDTIQRFKGLESPIVILWAWIRLICLETRSCFMSA